MNDLLIAILVVLSVFLAAIVGYLIGRRSMANFQQMTEALNGLQTTTNQMGATAARAIGVIQSPDADQAQIDAATQRIVEIEGQLATINSDLNAALPQNPTPQPV